MSISARMKPPQRPAQRMRLPFPTRCDDGVSEIERRRQRQDDTLKGKFEALFDKYERNLEDVSDIIDLETGKLVVDNGHLSGMRSECDVGSTGVRWPARVIEESGESDDDELQSSMSSNVSNNTLSSTANAVTEHVQVSRMGHDPLSAGLVKAFASNPNMTTEQLGLSIAKHLAQIMAGHQHAQNPVEPAWRAPSLDIPVNTSQAPQGERTVVQIAGFDPTSPRSPTTVKPLETEAVRALPPQSLSKTKVVPDERLCSPRRRLPSRESDLFVHLREDPVISKEDMSKHFPNKSSTSLRHRWENQSKTRSQKSETLIAPESKPGSVATLQTASPKHRLRRPACTSMINLATAMLDNDFPNPLKLVNSHKALTSAQMPHSDSRRENVSSRTRRGLQLASGTSDGGADGPANPGPLNLRFADALQAIPCTLLAPKHRRKGLQWSPEENDLLAKLVEVDKIPVKKAAQYFPERTCASVLAHWSVLNAKRAHKRAEPHNRNSVHQTMSTASVALQTSDGGRVQDNHSESADVEFLIEEHRLAVLHQPARPQASNRETTCSSSCGRNVPDKTDGVQPTTPTTLRCLAPSLSKLVSPVQVIIDANPVQCASSVGRRRRRSSISQDMLPTPTSLPNKRQKRADINAKDSPKARIIKTSNLASLSEEKTGAAPSRNTSSISSPRQAASGVHQQRDIARASSKNSRPPGVVQRSVTAKRSPKIFVVDEGSEDELA